VAGQDRKADKLLTPKQFTDPGVHSPSKSSGKAISESLTRNPLLAERKIGSKHLVFGSSVAGSPQGKKSAGNSHTCITGREVSRCARYWGSPD
jgi:hypothetical protein